MTRSQKLLLCCSLLCLALSIAGVFYSTPQVVITLIVLHSASLLYFCYLNYTSGPAAQAKEKAAQAEENYRQLSLEHEALTRERDQLRLLCEELQEDRPADSPDTDGSAPDLSDTSAEDPALSSMEASAYAGMLPPVGKTEDTEPVDLIRVVTDTIRELEPFAAKAGIHLQISSTLSSLPVKVDHERIRILFRNIIDNSIKYMNQSGCLIITLSTIADDIFIVLKDNGAGLSEEETPHIFEMNYQGSNRVSGNGLGLTQAKAIVDYYGGTIYARSQPGRGMGIYIQIPME